MKRREFISLLGGTAAAWPLAASAQQQANVARIGFLGPAPASSYWPRVEGLLAGLRDLGYVEGKNIVIEFRWAERVEQLPELAAELVVKPQEVVPGQTEPADWRLACEASMGPVPVVAMEPSRQRAISLL
jgi:putative tryptophan/tyrosine transport system substrate-binding protein